MHAGRFFWGARSLVAFAGCLVGAGCGSSSGGLAAEDAGVVVPSPCPGGSGPCSIGLSLTTDGGASRTYTLHVPPTLVAGATPLVVYLHAMSDTSSDAESATGFDDTADRNGFAVAYADSAQPNASFPEWNVYFALKTPNAPDDVGFVRALIASVEAMLQGDPRRVYVTGLSIGAVMSERLGVELSDTVAAIASVEGALDIGYGGADVAIPNAVAPVSVLLLHADQPADLIPYCGGQNTQFGGWQFPSQDTSFDYWSGSSADGCMQTTPDMPLCDSAGNLTSVVAKTASGCLRGTEVQLYRIEGGTHEWWPGSLDDPNTTPYNPDLDMTTGVTTNDLVWNFFAAHPRTP